jgi:glutamine amidotransferase
MLVIIDYGMGNLHSVLKALKRVGVEAMVSSSEKDIENAEKLILPGVGHFKNGMDALKRTGLDKLLHKKVISDKTPILGICLGMQLFTKFSEEGNTEGLGWIDAQTKKFTFQEANKNLKIPHMGWNNIAVQGNNRIFNGIHPDDSFYFVHSYFVQCNRPADILSTTVYGAEFVSSLQNGNITGMQFHPEKSHQPGLKILNNFCNSQ